MPTAAEKRRMRRMEHVMGIVVPLVTRRVLGGKDPQPGWLPRRLLTVVSGDVDVDAGCGAIWLLWRPWSSKVRTYTARIEHDGGQFRYTGAGAGGGATLDRCAAARRPAAGEPGQVGMIELCGYSGGVSWAWRVQHRGSSTDAPWVGASELCVAAEVDHLLIGEQQRRVQVPDHGRVIVAWKSPRTSAGGIRPLIVAARRDGSELSRLGPADVMDTYTAVQLGIDRG